MINVNEFKKNLITQALQGKLTEQLISDGTALELINEIVKTKSTPKKKWSILEVDNDNLPFAIPSSWTWCYLESISDSIGGKTNQIQANEVKEKGETPVVSQGKKYIDGYTSFSSKVITDIPVILFGDHTKIVKYINFEFVVGADGTKLLKPICVDNKFFYYLITYASFTIFDLGYSRHYSLLKKCPLPLPPLEEQKRIVAKLDEIFAELDKIDEKQTRLATIQEKMEAKILKLAIQGKLVEQRPEEGTGEELLKSLNKPVIDYSLNEVLPFDIPKSWVWCKLSDIGTTNIGLTYHPSDIVEKGTMVIRSSNIINGKLDYKDKVCVECSIRDNQYLKQNDIVICSRNGSKRLVGKNAIYQGDSNKYAFGAFMAVFRTSFYKYTHLYFNTDAFKRYFTSDDSKQINQVTQDILKESLIPLPPLEEQKRIVEKVEELLPLCRGN